MNAAATPRLPLKTSFAALLPLCLPLHAQVNQPVIPNAGSLLQQVQPALPAAPQANAPALQVQPSAAPGMPASAPFQVKAIRIVGNTAVSTDTLHALVAGAEGRSVTLAELEQQAARISAWYQQHGFPLSRAVVPAQTIKDGEVVIQVVEARYGAIRLNNGSRVKDALLAATLARLQPGRAIAERDLDRALLLLSDVPGVAVEAVIKPGAAVGTADLEVATRRNPATVASLVLDNAGNRYIGRARLGATAYLINPLRHGDVLDAGIISTGHGMDYGRVGYETLLGGAGTRAGAAYSSVHYKLQDEVSVLDAYGRAGVSSAWIKQPLLRGRESNLYLQGAYDAKRLRDHIGATATRTDRRLDNWMLSLNGDLRDGLLGGGLNAWSLGWTRGRTRFEDSDAELVDAASARTRGHFSKWNLNASRLQRLGARDALYLNLGAQWANTNLDSAEKMTVGGPYTVRAYDSGALSGDMGYVASLELRHELGAFAGSWQAIVFADSARIRINRDPWSGAVNSARLSGAGLGLTWSGPAAWRASLSVATPIGAAPPLLGRQRSTRAWATLGKGF